MNDKQIKHYRELNQSRKRLLSTLATNAANPLKDRNGASTNVYGAALRFIGVSDFLLEGDIDSFQDMLSKASKLRVQLFARFGRGEPISKSYVSVLAYKELLDALAACDLDTATKLAEQIGGHPDIDKDSAHTFDIALGYALKAAVLSRDQSKANEMLDGVLRADEHANFRGYGMIMNQLVSAEHNAFSDALHSIVAGHKREAREGVFKGLIDAEICVWGVGIANLVRLRGYSVVYSDPLIPPSLLAKA